MPNGGKLTIETAAVHLDEAYCREHVGVTPGDYVMLAVSDSGHGMDQETRARIFEPFFTTKEVGKGTGLGLSTVFGIVEQSGGHIWVYSEPGQGTTFKVYLPRVEEVTDEAPKHEAMSARGSETVLVCEDDEKIRALVRMILTARGYTVFEASGPGEAVLLQSRYTGPIHLLLTDVVMPQMNGRELAERLRSSLPNLKVLFMSGYTQNGIIHQGTLDQRVEFIQKPFTPEGLSRKIREVLDS
jgi:CheY-like chemotaxis protein